MCYCGKVIAFFVVVNVPLNCGCAYETCSVAVQVPTILHLTVQVQFSYLCNEKAVFAGHGRDTPLWLNYLWTKTFAWILFGVTVCD